MDLILWSPYYGQKKEVKMKFENVNLEANNLWFYCVET